MLRLGSRRIIQGSPRRLSSSASSYAIVLASLSGQRGRNRLTGLADKKSPKLSRVLTKPRPFASARTTELGKNFAQLIAAIRGEGAAERAEEQREDRGKKFREWTTIILIALTFIAVCWQVHEMIKVYEPIKT